MCAGSPQARSVEYHWNWTPALKDPAWTKWRIKDTHREPLVWEVKHVRFVPKDERGLPGEPLHLIAARNVADPTEVKYFLSNAPAETSFGELLLVAFSRWHVERCFEDQKTELGFDHFEGRSYLGLKRHQTVTAVTYPFLAEVRSERGGKNPQLTVCQVRIAADALVRSRPLGSRAAKLMIEAAASQIAYYQRRNAAARRGHTKTTLRKLHKQAVYVTDLPRCRWKT